MTQSSEVINFLLKLYFWPAASELTDLSDALHLKDEFYGMFVSLKMQAAYYIIRPHLHGLGYHRQSSPRVTLGELTLHLFLIKNSANRLHEVINSSQVHETTRGVRRATFPHVNTLSRRPETRQLEQKMRAHAMTRMFTDIFFLPSAILSNM